MTTTNPSHPSSPSVLRQQIFRYLVPFSERLISYLFPLFLLFVEFFLKFAFNTNTQDFIGPTLSSIGVGMLLTLTTYRDCDKKLQQTPLLQQQPELLKELQERQFIVQRAGVRIFTNFCWALTFVSIIIWISTLILSINFSQLTLLGWPSHYILGVASYIVAVILTEVKENI